MRSQEGVWVNNCIPLCRSCNASKGSQIYMDYFGPDAALRVIERSQSLNGELNSAFVAFVDDETDTAETGAQNLLPQIVDRQR